MQKFLSIALLLAIAGCSTQSAPVEEEPPIGSLSGQLSLNGAPLENTTVWLCLNENPADFKRSTSTNPAMDAEYNFQKLWRELNTVNQKAPRECALNTRTDETGAYEFAELPLGMYALYSAYSNDSQVAYWSEEVIFGGNEATLDLNSQNAAEVLSR
ncbi:hypothetical protein H6G00_01970 [Leptolyngbya sp. FACHB-541]|uniref:hypothetical protein n=1 Tax=Leptolyngbya sp. FACHB-541 TaxID=2692810 RepID=UPI001689D081|nr:hypothetical protein [Leptolyngbya sp. FACHB-541]MBD1995399.1 hypothetical protein [Leptolyngbya sp. FACHB-541]